MKTGPIPYLIVFFICLIQNVSAQDNLMVNGSLEDEWSLSDLISKDGRTTYAKGWFIPTTNSPDYFFKSKRSTIQPVSGFGVAGIVAFKRKLGVRTQSNGEFLGAELKQPLESGKTYCICYHLALHRTSKWAVANFGVKFFDEKPHLSQKTMRRMEPDIVTGGEDYSTNMKWLKHCTYYKAKGGEKYLVFGPYGRTRAKKIKNLEVERLRDRDVFTNKAYYMLDEVSVSESIECGCSKSNEPVVFPRKKVTFILDMSSSMKEGGVFDSLKTRLYDWRLSLHDSDLVTIVTFSSSARVVFEGNSAALSKDTLKFILDPDKLSGGTNIANGLKEGYELHLKDTAHYDGEEVVLISDGRFFLNESIRERIAENYSSRGLILHFIHVENELKKNNYDEIPGLVYHHLTRGGFDAGVMEIYQRQLETTYCDPIPPTKQDLPRDYTLILDFSGSMRSKYGDFEQEVVNGLLLIPDSSSLSVLTFSDGTTPVFTGKRADLTPEVFRGFFNLAAINGGTHQDQAMKEGYKYAIRKSDSTAVARVIIVSDISKNKVGLAYQAMDDSLKSVEGIELGYTKIKLIQNQPKHYQFDNATSLFSRCKRKDIYEEAHFMEDIEPTHYRYQAYAHPPAKYSTSSKWQGVTSTMVRLVVIGGLIYIGLVSKRGD